MEREAKPETDTTGRAPGTGYPCGGTTGTDGEKREQKRHLRAPPTVGKREPRGQSGRGRMQGPRQAGAMAASLWGEPKEKNDNREKPGREATGDSRLDGVFPTYFQIAL